MGKTKFSNSLKEQLAPLRKALKNQPQSKETPAKTKKAPSKSTKPPSPVLELLSSESEEAVNDSEMVEFWREVADTTPIDARGRQQQSKKTNNKQKSISIPPQEQYEEDLSFEEMLELSDQEIENALVEKKGTRPLARPRAMEKRRVSLIGLSREDALERLLRYLRAAKERRETVITVLLGKDSSVRWAVEGFLAQAHDLVASLEETKEANSIGVRLVSSK